MKVILPDFENNSLKVYFIMKKLKGKMSTYKENHMPCKLQGVRY
jgi:hypothetical protein